MDLSTQFQQTLRELMREALAKPEGVERAMLDQEQAPCEVVHFFGPGVYIRELSMKAGTFAIGHRQKYAHTNILLRGKVAILGQDGAVQVLEAPMMFVGAPGRKIGYVLEDMVWQNIYATEDRDVETLEAIYLEKSPAWEDARAARLAMQSGYREVDRADFSALVAFLGMTPAQVRKQVENLEDQTPLPEGTWNVKIGPSAIEGQGVFLTSDAHPGQTLGPARIDGKRTPLGRYTNHSATPNAHMRLEPSGDIMLVAACPIMGCAGGFDGEEVTVDYRQALRLSGVLVGEEA